VRILFDTLMNVKLSGWRSLSKSFGHLIQYRYQSNEMNASERPI
jgi:hypothetical protein